MKETGYFLEDKSIHVCGYEHNRVLYQLFTGDIVRYSKLNYNKKGVYFVANGKRHYISKSKK